MYTSDISKEENEQKIILGVYVASGDVGSEPLLHNSKTCESDDKINFDTD